MVPELLSLGADVFAHLDALPQRVVVVVSSDLAHTHLASGPYGYSAAAEPFDEAVGAWAGSLDGDALLVKATRFADQVGSMADDLLLPAGVEDCAQHRRHLPWCVGRLG